MILDNSRYPLRSEFLTPCCVLFSLLLVAGMGILLGLSVGLGWRSEQGQPGWVVSPRRWLPTAGCASKGSRFFWAPATALLSRQA